jgi:hypothetical protein
LENYRENWTIFKDEESMTDRKGLRSFVEAVVVGKVQYQKIGEAFTEYLNSIYVIYSSILQSLLKDKEEGKFNRRKNEERKNLVLTHIVNLSTPLSLSQLKAGLERIGMKYESAPVRYTVESLSSFFAKIAKRAETAQKIFGAIAAVGGVIWAAYGFFKRWKLRKQKIANRIMSEEYGKRIYQDVVYPELTKILDELMMLRIQDERRLRRRFFQATEKMGQAAPDLQPYFQAWGS